MSRGFLGDKEKAMPLYDYECKKCHSKLENVMQGINDPKLTTCPECKEETLERLIGDTSFALKPGGCGWGDQGYSEDG